MAIKRKPPPRPKRCPWNNALRCDEHYCPLEDEGWFELISRWALIGRTAKGIGLELSARYGNEEEALAWKCSINQVFQNSDEAMGFLVGELRMTEQICQDLHRARSIWRDLGYGISHKRAQQRYDKKMAAQ